METETRTRTGENEDGNEDGIAAERSMKNGRAMETGTGLGLGMETGMENEIVVVMETGMEVGMGTGTGMGLEEGLERGMDMEAGRETEIERGIGTRTGKLFTPGTLVAVSSLVQKIACETARKCPSEALHVILSRTERDCRTWKATADLRKALQPYRRGWKC